MIQKHKIASVTSRLIRSRRGFALFLFLLIFSACQRPETGLSGDPDNGGIQLPEGFEALVVADSIGSSRHLVVNDNGDIYVKLRVDEGGVVAMRDTDGDGKADIIEKFGEFPDEESGTAMDIYNGYIYFSNSLGIYRNRLRPGELLPEQETETVIRYNYRRGEHKYKPVTFDGEGNMYVPFGAPGDNCQEINRRPGNMGVDPCLELEENAGIWRFDPNRLDQTQADGTRYATGIRSATAIDWDHFSNNLYAVQHGRDHLARMWPEIYSRWESAMLPAEEFMRVTENSDFGWPYCYYDQLRGQRYLSPEYGGDRYRTDRCTDFEEPLIAFPGHWAPNDLLFYTGDQFPERYRHGAFIAFHGSGARAGYPQAGYAVIFVPFENGEPTGEWEVFANGFAGVDPLLNRSDALYRPMGLATGPDGSLYISDSVQGKIWRVMYRGDRNNFGGAQLAGMERVKQTASNIRTPDMIQDYLMSEHEPITLGESIYQTYCMSCHQLDGEGSFPRYPPLAGTDWVTGDKTRLLHVIMNGLEGPVVIRGETYNFPMPRHDFLSDEEVAGVATYIRQNFGNQASEVSPEEVREFRSRFTAGAP